MINQQIFDMIQQIDKVIQAIEVALKEKEPSEHIVCAIMGGDGSMSRNIDYMLSQSSLIKENVNLIAFAILPFGTGNDCARSLGWGGRDFGQNWAKDLT